MASFTQTELGWESTSSQSAGALGAPLSYKASPSPPPIYIGGFRAFETQLCQGKLKPIPRSSSSRSDFCGGRAEPCRSGSSPPPAPRHATGELIYFFVSLAGSRRPRSSSSCTCAERGGAVRSALDRNGSWDGSRDGSWDGSWDGWWDGSRDVKMFHYINHVS